MNEQIRNGLISEFKVRVKLLELGYQVLVDINPNSKTDIFVRCKDDRFLKIQVKKIKISNGHKSVRISSKGKHESIRYNKIDVDFFIGVDGDNFHIIPFEIAYADNRKEEIYVGRNFINRWDLLPDPLVDNIPEQIKDSQEKMFFVA